jgi:hypothetical protein
MARRVVGSTIKQPGESGNLSSITISGYKSIDRPQTAQIKPLTIIAGANSSGKSSLMQALLLMKQTINVGYAPGPLLLNGPNVKLASLRDIQPKHGLPQSSSIPFRIKLGFDWEAIPFVELSYSSKRDRTLYIDYMSFNYFGETITLREGMPSRLLRNIVTDFFSDTELAEFNRVVSKRAKLSIWAYRCFLTVAIDEPDSSMFMTADVFTPSPEAVTARRIENIIHLPGLRGNPERSYPVTSADNTDFPGTFEYYTASILRQWQLERQTGKLRGVASDLKRLGLTSQIRASMHSDSAVEIMVGRLPSGRPVSERDMVNIADVGIGVSQALPLIVALHAANPGQIVYVEQPELHLHPRAQVELANVIISAVNRGVIVIAETHSSLLLLAIQTAVALNKIDSSAVALNWFRRNRNGQTIITYGNMDKSGAFGDWPADFSDVEFAAEGAFLRSSVSVATDDL